MSISSRYGTAVVAMLLAWVSGTSLMARASEPVYQYSGEIRFDIKKVPFSRFGSFISFSREGTSLPEALYLCNMHGGLVSHESFRVDLLEAGNPVAFTESATPTLLRLESQGGWVEICFAETDLVRMRGKGVGLRLTALSGNTFPAGDGTWEVNAPSKFRLEALDGTLRINRPQRDGGGENRLSADYLPSQSGTFEGLVGEYRSVWVPRPYAKTFEAALESAKTEYSAWLTRMPDVPTEFGAAAELAAYINWESVVGPLGNFKRPAMLMSKNWMTGFWSWDNCFNAMALAYKHPQLAWDQMMILVDNQDPNGAFPDVTSDDGHIWSYTKPPIHGWTLLRMMKQPNVIDRKRIEEIYEPLARATEWYFKYRDTDHDGVPEYNHGNDSGWDNATPYAVGVPIEGPELCAYLAIQMEFLSDAARRLGRPVDAGNWTKRSKDLIQKMLSHSWKGDRFVAPHAGDHKTVESQSLYLYLPIILGKRLPPDVSAKLVADLKSGSFLTDNGLATESPKSPLYEPDGYWRGPIWAPSTMIIVDGLDQLGEKEFAREIRQRFCRMASRSGMAENYNAQTGDGLRDPAYTWTSSVFLIFAHELLESRQP